MSLLNILLDKPLPMPGCEEEPTCREEVPHEKCPPKEPECPKGEDKHADKGGKDGDGPGKGGYPHKDKDDDGPGKGGYPHKDDDGGKPPKSEHADNECKPDCKPDCEPEPEPCSNPGPVCEEDDGCDTVAALSAIPAAEAVDFAIESIDAGSFDYADAMDGYDAAA